jgi:hypothetical protein
MVARGGGANARLVGGPADDSCGPGRDTVVADPEDYTASDCEKVR